MTPIQIAYFKHFLYDKGIQRIYISLYRSRRIKGGPGGDSSGNPVSLEQFLSEQPYFRVIMNAFYFITGSQYGFDYWKEINKQWIKYWDMNENNFSNEKYAVLGGTFGILRQNWDSKEYWKPETKEQTYKRMGIEPPPGFEACSPSILAESQVEEHSETPSEESDPLAGFTEVDTKKYNGNGRRIKTIQLPSILGIMATGLLSLQMSAISCLRRDISSSSCLPIKILMRLLLCSTMTLGAVFLESPRIVSIPMQLSIQGILWSIYINSMDLRRKMTTI